MKSKSARARVTIKTVAADAGVSVSAVSKVLREAYGVSEDLRSRVKKSMAKLRYRPHAAARGMRGRTHTVGVLMTDSRNAFNGDLLEGMNTAFLARQIQALVGINHYSSAIEASLVDAMIDRQMDGLIMIGPRLRRAPNGDPRSNPANLDDTAKRIPTVVIAHYDESPYFDTVNNDDVLGARLAVNHLAENGYRRIVFVTPEVDGANRVNVAQRRYQGYLEAMEASGLARHRRLLVTQESGDELKQAIVELLSGKNRPDALFCWSDVTALEVIGYVGALGLKIPGDVAIIGYDNTPACEYSQNGLSSIDQAGQALGVQAARLLLERIEGRMEPERYVLSPRLVARASTARRPGQQSL